MNVLTNDQVDSQHLHEPVSLWIRTNQIDQSELGIPESCKKYHTHTHHNAAKVRGKCFFIEIVHCNMGEKLILWHQCLHNIGQLMTASGFEVKGDRRTNHFKI